MRAHRRKLPVVLILAMLFVGTPATGQESQASSTVRIAIAGDENNLTPYGITFRSGKSVDLINLIYDPLFTRRTRRIPSPFSWRTSEAATTTAPGPCESARMSPGTTECR